MGVVGRASTNFISLLYWLLRLLFHTTVDSFLVTKLSGNYPSSESVEAKYQGTLELVSAEGTEM